MPAVVQEGEVEALSVGNITAAQSVCNPRVKKSGAISYHLLASTAFVSR